MTTVNCEYCCEEQHGELEEDYIVVYRYRFGGIRKFAICCECFSNLRQSMIDEGSTIIG